MLAHAYRPYARTAAAMRNAEGFMQIKMGDIGTDFTRPAQAHQRVKVGAVQINLSAMLMDKLANLPERFFKNAVRGRIGNH